LYLLNRKTKFSLKISLKPFLKACGSLRASPQCLLCFKRVFEGGQGELFTSEKSSHYFKNACFATPICIILLKYGIDYDILTKAVMTGGSPSQCNT